MAEGMQQYFFMIDTMTNHLEDPPALLDAEDSDCSSESNDNQSTQSQERMCRPCQENTASNSKDLEKSNSTRYSASACIENSCDSSLFNRFENKRDSTAQSGLFGFLGFEKNCYCMCQIKRHCTMDSAWLLVGKKIYDVTTYIKLHPGGERSILRKCGGVDDCTIDMKFHSQRAQKLWRQFYIGDLKRCRFSKN